MDCSRSSLYSNCDEQQIFLSTTNKRQAIISISSSLKSVPEEDTYFNEFLDTYASYTHNPGQVPLRNMFKEVKENDNKKKSGFFKSLFGKKEKQENLVFRSSLIS